MMSVRRKYVQMPRGIGGRAFWLVVILGSYAATAHPALADSPGEADTPQQLAAATVEIFVAKCAQCHSPDSGKRRAIKHWADSRDLAELVKKYVEPETRTAEGYEDSTLWLVLTDDPERRMPPVKSAGGQLTPGEFETIGQWIAAGASTQTHDTVESSGVAPPLPQAKELGFSRRLQRWLGKFHPAAVHVPIGLLLAAAVAELIWWLTGRDPFDFACRFCTVVAAAAAVPAAAMGWMAGSFESDIGYTLTLHRWMGVAVVVLALVTAGLSLAVGQSRDQLTPRPRLMMRWLVLINAVLVSVTGHFGGELVHGHDYFAW